MESQMEEKIVEALENVVLNRKCPLGTISYI